MSKNNKHSHNWQMMSAGMYWSEYECIVCKIKWVEQDDDPDNRPHPEGRKRPLLGCHPVIENQTKGRKMYSYPEGLKISFIEDIALDENTRKAIIAGAEWLAENPEFEPKYEQLFNVILAKDKATVAMTEEVFKRADVDSDDMLPHMPLLGVDFSTYCIAITMIHRVGWSGYIENLIRRNERVRSEELDLS